MLKSGIFFLMGQFYLLSFLQLDVCLFRMSFHPGTWANSLIPILTFNSRTPNWQKFCMKDPNLLAFLLRVSVHLDDGVSPIILQLVQSALCPQPGQPVKRSGKASSPVKAVRKEKSKSQEPESSESEDFCFILVNQVWILLLGHPSH